MKTKKTHFKRKRVSSSSAHIIKKKKDLSKIKRDYKKGDLKIDPEEIAKAILKEFKNGFRK